MDVNRLFSLECIKHAHKNYRSSCLLSGQHDGQDSHIEPDSVRMSRTSAL